MKKINKKRNTIIKYSDLENKVAALWTRALTQRQRENNCSLETQERICKEYAANHGITIKKQYRGVHKKAKTEGLYSKMIAEVVADPEINIILVSSFDRLSRDGYEVIMTEHYLKSKGVFVISATQPTDPDSSPLMNLLNTINVSSYEEEN